MKKLILALAFIFMVSTAHAELITYDASVTGASASLTWLKDALNIIYNNENGNINSDNIATGGVNSMDIATAANPLVRENELVGEMVYSGMTIATSTSLASTITAGVAYVENDSDGTLHRVVTADTAKTFTSTPAAEARDWWVYLSFGGAFYYNEQASGASQPTTPDNYLLIAKVVTSTTAITSVTDYRQITPTNLRIYTDYKQGCTLSRDIGTATTIYVGPGEVELGTTGKVRRNTTNTTLNLASTGRNALDTGTVAAGSFYHVFAVPDDGTTTNFDVIASLSSTDATGVTDERLIGWFYANANATVSLDAVGAWRAKGGDAPNIYHARKNGLADSMTIGTMTKYNKARIITSGRPIIAYYGAIGSVGGGVVGLLMSEISIDNTTVSESQTTAGIPESTSDTASGSYFTPLATGQHTIDLTVTDRNATIVVSGWYLNIVEQ